MQKEHLPQGWEITQIENIANVISGGTPNSKKKHFFTEPKNGIAWVTPADLSGYKEKYISNGKRDLTEDGYKSCSAKLMPKGSVLLSSRAPIGYVVIAKDDISTNQGFKNLVLPNGIYSEYCYFYLKHIRNYLENLGTGTTFKEISATTVKKVPFLLPNYAEQTQIATILDDLLARVQAIQTRLNKIPELLKQFRQSVLADAVSGRLTEKWREENGIAFEWEETKLKHIIILISGQDLKPNQYTNEIVGIPYITGASNFTKNGLSFNRYTQYESKISEKNDLLITCKGTIGEMCFLNVDRAHIARQVMAIRVGEKIFYNYLYYFLQKEIDKIKSKAKGLIPGIAREDILTLGITLPTLEEQKAIVSIVENYLTLADTIETQTQQALEKVNLLTQSILAKAFRGELTEKWRAENQALISGENSAKALLAKIKSELQAVKKRK